MEASLAWWLALSQDRCEQGPLLRRLISRFSVLSRWSAVPRALLLPSSTTVDHGRRRGGV